MIKLDKSICGDLSQSLTREWLETNTLGGFSSATIAGANTRRYHGLLTACTHPPVGRQVLLSKLEETVMIEGVSYELATNVYEGAVHPQGYKALQSFRLDPWPVYTFEVAGVVIEKSVFLVYDRNLVAISYRILSGAKDLSLEIRPLIAYRDYHATTHASTTINGSLELQDGTVRIKPYQGMTPLYFAHNGDSVEEVQEWYNKFVYDRERERGLDFTEDLFCPLEIRGTAGPGERLIVLASTSPSDVSEFSALERRELKHRRAIRMNAPVDDELIRDLTVAADQFIAKRGDGYTIMAGYPWFTDWGRDTMIALPGLTLFTGRFDVARSILKTFAGSIDQGMLPNRFTDYEEQPEYNTVDATLWFYEAVRTYVEQSGDESFARELYPTLLLSIIDWHIRGTRYNIRMQNSGLLEAGDAGVQLTWMDAKIGNWVVTPRTGKPVEIQALWYNALMITADLAKRFGDRATELRLDDIATRLRWSFNRTFWNSYLECLYDVVNGGPPDASIRPNQILAVSLHHSMLPPERARSVVRVVQEHLLTPYGLRTLSPADPKYRGRYTGDSYSRDSVYHQGTVWPWLLGPFVTAYVRVNGRSKKARGEALTFFEAFGAHLRDAGVGQVSEIVDGDFPHDPKGCFAQAWSVGELMRSLCQDVYEIKPSSERSSGIAEKVGA